jgi:hypothetical protein
MMSASRNDRARLPPIRGGWTRVARPGGVCSCLPTRVRPHPPHIFNARHPPFESPVGDFDRNAHVGNSRHAKGREVANDQPSRTHHGPRRTLSSQGPVQLRIASGIGGITPSNLSRHIDHFLKPACVEFYQAIRFRRHARKVAPDIAEELKIARMI